LYGDLLPPETPTLFRRHQYFPLCISVRHDKACQSSSREAAIAEQSLSLSSRARRCRISSACAPSAARWAVPVGRSTSERTRTRSRSPRGKKTSRTNNFSFYYCATDRTCVTVLCPWKDRTYKAVLNRGTPEEKQVSSERHFCSKCSAMLWLWDETWCVPTTVFLDNARYFSFI